MNNNKSKLLLEAKNLQTSIKILEDYVDKIFKLYCSLLYMYSNCINKNIVNKKEFEENMLTKFLELYNFCETYSNCKSSSVCKLIPSKKQESFLRRNKHINISFILNETEMFATELKLKRFLKTLKKLKPVHFLTNNRPKGDFEMLKDEIVHVKENLRKETVDLNTQMSKLKRVKEKITSFKINNCCHLSPELCRYLVNKYSSIREVYLCNLLLKNNR